MPIGGKLVLKGGETLKGVEKKKKKKKKIASEDALNSEKQEGGLDSEKPEGNTSKPVGISVQSGKTYEEEFDIETKRTKEGKVKNTPWGSSYRAPPEILHGYAVKVSGKTAEERLDLRTAAKSDKFCK